MLFISPGFLCPNEQELFLSLYKIFLPNKNGHDTFEIQFDIDAIPEVKCSFKKKWWR